MTLPGALAEEVRRWIAEDPDPATRAELEALLSAGPAGEPELADRFSDRLHFGTAGLRGAVAAGPNRMNRAVVRKTTAALAAWLRSRHPGSESAGVVLGCDARHGSLQFLDEAAQVLAGAGFRVHLLETKRPTPLLAFAVSHLEAAAGVMITASHNPPADNGYKLYLGDGAQIVPPVDEEIEALMDEVPPLSLVTLGALSGPLVTHHGSELEKDYTRAVASRSPAPGGAADLSVVYTPLHGVAGATLLAAMAQAGFPEPFAVGAQAEPDPDFPTVAFPNPEEPGALDLALDEARRRRADVVIANDPDGDRLSIALPDPSADGGWRQLSGDQVGSILGDYEIAKSASEPDPDSRLVVSTVVSSSLLSKIAAEAGVGYTETLTGFKWVVRGPERVPGSSFLFGYEEALGYCVGTVVRDKDGIGAALAWLAMMVEARSRGERVLDILDALESRHGVHLTSQLSARSDNPGATMERLRAEPPASLGGRTVGASVDLAAGRSGGNPGKYDGLPVSDVLVYELDRARIVVRPSGTEPKLKVYFEVVEPVGDGDLAAARERAAKSMAELRAAVEALLVT